MAETQQKFGTSSDPGTEVDPISSGVAVPAKSFIVGRYDEDGRKKKGGQVVGGVGEAVRLQKLMLSSMRTRGGELAPGFVMTSDGPVKASQYKSNPKPVAKITKPAIKIVKKGKAKSIDEPLSYLETVSEAIEAKPSEVSEQFEEPPQTFSVTFTIESGTIKSSVDAILEDELGLVLVYKDVDSISYVPKNGGKLSLTLPGKRSIPVMFLGIQLSWYNSTQQLLLFVKTNTKE